MAKIPPKGTPEYKAYLRKIGLKGGKNKKGKKHKTTIVFCEFLKFLYKLVIIH